MSRSWDLWDAVVFRGDRIAGVGLDQDRKYCDFKVWDLLRGSRKANGPPGPLGRYAKLDFADEGVSLPPTNRPLLPHEGLTFNLLQARVGLGPKI